MKTPETSALFEKRINEASGVEYYVLTKKVATYQQSFYFSNNSMTNDGRFLWFYCSFPPVFNASTRQLGVVDFEKDEIHLFNDTLFSGASPYVDPETGDVYFTWGNQLLKRSPYKDAHTIELARVKTKGRMMRMSTHLTPTPDKKNFSWIYMKELTAFIREQSILKRVSLQSGRILIFISITDI